MKNLYKAVSAALSAVMVLSGCTPLVQTVPSVSEENTSAVAVDSMKDADEIYSLLESEINCHNNRIVMQDSVDKDEIYNAVRKLKDKHPDIFWLDGYSVTYDSSQTEVKFNILNNYSTDKLETMHSQLESAADRIVSEIPQETDIYDKILFVHDYIINSTEYDNAGADSGENGIWGTSYGCLVEGKAVCQGYSEAFTYIMNRLGVECGMCIGDSVRGRHAWNYINFDGSYYWIDVTWDDPENEISNEGEIRHSYFMIDDDMLRRTRTPDTDQIFVPECNSLENNYFVRNGGYFEKYDFDSIGSYMAENADNHEIEIMFADELAYNQAITGLFINEEIWNVSGYVWLDGEISYSQDDAMYVLKIGF